MKLYNHTKLPDKALENLLTRAGRVVGARTSKVPIVVTATQYRGSSGRAYQGTAWKSPSFRNKMRWIDTDGGFFKITVRTIGDALFSAQDFYECALHEWSHIAAFQKGTFRYYKKHSRWANRPCELKAIDATDDALKRVKNRHDDVILNLAIEIEKLQNK